MRIGYWKRLSIGAAVALTAAISGVMNVSAGSNGQQFTYINGFFLNGPTQMCVSGTNNYGNPANGCWNLTGTYTTTSGWWWKGSAHITASGGSVGNTNVWITIPVNQSANCWSYENDNGHQGPYNC